MYAIGTICALYAQCRRSTSNSGIHELLPRGHEAWQIYIRAILSGRSLFSSCRSLSTVSISTKLTHRTRRQSKMPESVEKTPSTLAAAHTARHDDRLTLCRASTICSTMSQSEKSSLDTPLSLTPTSTKRTANSAVDQVKSLANDLEQARNAARKEKREKMSLGTELLDNIA